jgi:protein-L-isoaspartate(D-aspartate) O-methyltransferase
LSRSWRGWWVTRGAFGIEIIPELAAQSRADLTALDLENVTIVAKNGTSGHTAGAAFDRVIITAATWDLPAALFEQVVDGGFVLVPLELGRAAARSHC